MPPPVPEPCLYLLATRDLVPGGDLLAAAAAALRGGVDMVQWREKAPPDEGLLELARGLRDLCAAAGVPFVVNDDPRLAVALGAAGVHVGQEDCPVAVARAIVGPGRWVGLSTHDEDQVRRAADLGVDMIGLGPIFPTTTKDAGSPRGLGVLGAARRIAPELPAFPIGGIGEANVAEIRAAGYRRIAVSSAILGARDPQAAAARLRAALSP